MPDPAGEDHEAIDVLFQGVPGSVCCHRVGDVIIDPGPASSAEGLLAALGDREPSAILLTHIHLDHAGAAGILARRWPRAQVWVHERGARHLADPARLIDSATRIYGDAMERLWGEIVPVPSERLRLLTGGERDGGFRVAYTPGHAVHHVSYLHESSGVAFSGDVAGVRIGTGPVFPPTPPPDIDLEAWRGSLDVLREWAPTALGLTHFGVHGGVQQHLAELREGLGRWGDLARRTDAADYEREVVAALAGLDADTRRSYLTAMPPGTLHGGLARYWASRTG
jgi:glyoxylase-like metal-dependent hydrolase (beta-lactamase superfamily II)